MFLYYSCLFDDLWSLRIQCSLSGIRPKGSLYLDKHQILTLCIGNIILSSSFLLFWFGCLLLFPLFLLREPKHSSIPPFSF